MQFIIKAYDGADIVNASENGYSRQNIDHFIENNMRTESGKRLACSVFCLDKVPEE